MFQITRTRFHIFTLKKKVWSSDYVPLYMYCTGQAKILTPFKLK